MKKLMIAAAIVCAAVASQAATVNWSTGALGAPTSATDGTPIATKIGSTVGEWIATLYVYDKTGTELLVKDSVTMTVSKDDRDRFVRTFSGIEGADSTTWANTTGITVAKDYTAVSPNTDIQWKIVVEGETADYTAEKGFLANESIKTDGESGTTDLLGGNVSTFQSADWTVAAVPEPTSGLLLLLGVAGLALRRRRA